MANLQTNHKVTVLWDRSAALTRPTKPNAVTFSFYAGLGDRPLQKTYYVRDSAIKLLVKRLQAMSFALDLRYVEYGHGYAVWYSSTDIRSIM